MLTRIFLLLAAFGANSAAFGGLEPAAKPEPAGGLVIVITASYPGANATVVADTVAAPIEQ
jgi:multidrug efflux pump subunit AcrB